jgi:hypothetical protein
LTLTNFKKIKRTTQARAPALHTNFTNHRQECLCHKILKIEPPEAVAFLLVTRHEQETQPIGKKYINKKCKKSKFGGDKT